jgi:transposase-like protein
VHDTNTDNIVEQDHRAITLLPEAMLEFKDFRCARILLAGVELLRTVAQIARKLLWRLRVHIWHPHH